MTGEINQSPSSPMEGSPEESPLIAIHPSVEEKTNIMTLEELNALRDTYSFPFGVQIRLPDEGETITSTRPGEVAFYEAAFPAGLRFPLHPTIRNLFSLNSNPKSDQGWLYFKARNKKVLLGGYPSNVKGWKSKFFFVSGETNGRFLKGRLGRAPPRVPRTWRILDKHCNNPPRLYGDEPKVFEEIFRASRMAGDNLLSREAPSSSSDVGESQNPHEQARRESPSRDDSIECLGSIRTELRRLLPHILDLTLLRWTGGKVLDPILDRFLNVPSSNPSSESCSDSSLPVELESDAMSKRVSFKKIGEKLGKTAGASSGTPALCEGGRDWREADRREASRARPARRERATMARKEKVLIAGPMAKRRRLRRAKPRPRQLSLLLALGRDLSSPREGGQAHLGPNGDEALPRDRSGVGARLIFNRPQQGGWGAGISSGGASCFDGNEHANDELGKMKSDRGLLTDKLERSGLLVNELREALNKAKEFAVEEFKSSSEFMVAVEDSASKYFGERFDFCKVQLRRHHSDLAIDLEGTVVDQDLLAEQDEAAEDNEREKLGENKGVIKYFPEVIQYIRM
ncbi:hypothetical protein Acr_02g0014310 [Actinidia rufa]|uniref:Uncharacterized protein n=1 Tax=Actinidia rufa TaxID=165716 RepID=A0A7J0E9L5_9ERIC|nr:hypothetical protein Acr_02g0014310 [Actinidia rufa]